MLGHREKWLRMRQAGSSNCNNGNKGRASTEAARGGGGRLGGGSLPPVATNPALVRFLAPLNESVDAGKRLSESTLQQLWHDWLWGSDPTARLLEVITVVIPGEG